MNKPWAVRMKIRLTKRIMGLNMNKILVYLGVVLMIISTTTDGIVIADAWEDIEEMNSSAADWREKEHLFVAILSAIGTASIFLLVSIFLQLPASLTISEKTEDDYITADNEVD